MPTSPPVAAPRPPYLEVFLLSFAALVLEIGYTRIISYKLFYYHTYLVIGLAMLGMGFGGALVAAWPRRVAPRRMFGPIATAGACVTGAAYVLVARIELSVLNFSADATAPLSLLVVCGAVFAGFGIVGVLLSAVFADAPERMPRLYLADLAGAALGCAAAVPLVSGLGAPAAVMAAATTIAAAGAIAWARVSTSRATVAGIVVVVLASLTLHPVVLPDPVPDPVKTMHPRHLAGRAPLFSAWSPVFRIDVTSGDSGHDDILVVHHDGLWGSALHRWDGDPRSLAPFDHNERALPFRTLMRRPRQVVIIGAAGGHEILAALHFESEHVNAVELNPVTVDLVRKHFADFVGHIATNPAVTITNDEGRSWLARHSGPFDLVYFVAPDSYAAMNSATSGAFVLSESYLYTVEMIAGTLQRLAPDGLLAMQFGEDDYDAHPNRTIRYVATARAALERLGFTDAAAHIAVATTKSLGDVSTILISPRPIDGERARAFALAATDVPQTKVRWLPGSGGEDGPVTSVLSLGTSELAAWLSAYPFTVGPVYDDAPFFWHFARFSALLGGRRPTGLGVNWEASAAGERVLLATLAAAMVFACACLALPLLVAGSAGASPRLRWTVAAYFACLGIGFMLFEVALIQKLALVLGYPTYSLTVTLLALLVAAGFGSLASERWAGRVPQTALGLAAAIVILSGGYAFGLDAVTPTLLTMPLAARIAVVLALTAPLGFVLGTFLPLGVSCILAKVETPGPLVAWAWATNGFFSVIGSVATTILAMSSGFRLVFAAAGAVYLVACWLLARLAR